MEIFSIRRKGESRAEEEKEQRFHCFVRKLFDKISPSEWKILRRLYLV